MLLSGIEYPYGIRTGYAMALNINSKTGRTALLTRREPYWSRVSAGLYIGYRKLKQGQGTWIARFQEKGDTKKKYHALGCYQDDKTAYDDARKDALAWLESMDQGVSSKGTTVKEACEAYVEHLKAHKGLPSSNDAAGRFQRTVYDHRIAKLQLSKLKTSDLKAWLNTQLKNDEEDDEEDLRRSKDSANRNLSSLKAALNLALKDRLVATDAGWKTVTGFAGAGKRRDAYLDPKQRNDLIDACPNDLKLLVKAMLLTAARPGELASLKVTDFNKAHGSIDLTGKTGRRTSTLSTAAIKFFSEQSKGKLPAAPLLSREYGDHWNKDSWKKLFKEAVKTAGLPDNIVMYTLRHVAISEMIMGGMDSFIVAKLAGTSVAMIEKHYGHLRHTETRQQLDSLKLI